MSNVLLTEAITLILSVIAVLFFSTCLLGKSALHALRMLFRHRGAATVRAWRSLTHPAQAWTAP